jgi:hypothetical protein
MTKMNTEFANRLLLYPEVNKATGLTFKEFSSEQFPSAIIKKPPWLPFPVPRGLAILGICLYSKQVYLSLSLHVWCWSKPPAPHIKGFLHFGLTEMTPSFCWME